MEADKCYCYLCGKELELKTENNSEPLVRCNICHEEELLSANEDVMLSKVRQRTNVLALISVISFLGYFFIMLSFSTLNRWDDLATWLFDMMRYNVPDLILSMVFRPIFVRVVASGVFCMTMIWLCFRLRAKKSVSTIPYFLPIITVISHAVGWFGVGAISFGWLLDLPILFLSISTILVLQGKNGIKDIEKSTKIFIGIVVASFVIWLYMFSIDMSLVGRDELPRFARIQEVAMAPRLYAYNGIGWGAWPNQMDIMCQMLQEDCTGHRVYFFPPIFIAIIVSLYLLGLFVVIRIMGRLYTRLQKK